MKSLNPLLFLPKFNFPSLNDNRKFRTKFFLIAIETLAMGKSTMTKKGGNQNFGGEIFCDD
jgi:hypothetical protein